MQRSDLLRELALRIATVSRPHPVRVAIDGVFLLRPELRAYWDFSIFAHADFATTVGRAERRDRESFRSASEVRRKYQARYVPGQQLYLREVAPPLLAALVVDNNDPADPQIRHTPANHSTGRRVDAAARKEAFFIPPPLSGTTFGGFETGKHGCRESSQGDT